MSTHSLNKSALGEWQIERLQRAATQAAERAHAPYSGFRVGAALLLTDGAVVTGANVENMSYGLTICAERAAIVTMVVQHGPETRPAAVCVTNLNGAVSPPCGACRQVLAEFMDQDAWILFPGEGGQEVRRLSEILPFVFQFSGPRA